MGRTLTSPATTEAAKTSGAFPRHILEVQWGGATGTKYYSGEDLTLAGPTTVSGRVLEWGQIQQSGEPQKVGGHGQVTLRIADPDLSLKTLIETKPGPQNKYVYIHLFFEGTTWPTDRVTIFGGVIEAPLSWDDKTGTWTWTLKGVEVFYNRLLGRFIDRDLFSDVICNECEGEIIPIVYGNPCYRVPACVIDRPGMAQIQTTLNQFDAYLYIHNLATEQLFTTGSTISLVVGYPDNYEIITGSFATPGDYTKFTIATRSSVQADGTGAGLFSSGGRSYFMIAAADISSPTVSRGGYPISFWTGSAWVTTLITQWETSGADIIVCDIGTLGLTGTETWQIGKYPNTLTVWPPGTPVYEQAAWKYIVNWLPSKSVDAVEAKGAVALPGGASLEAFLKYDTGQYSVNLNDTAYNTALGRGGGDPGVTTITITNPPAYSGFTDNRIYVTLKGITNDNTTSGTVLSNPADIIKNLLTNDFLGDLGAGFVNSTAFTTAASAISTVMGFAITKPFKLMDVCADLAFQSMSLFFWDGGVAQMVALSNTLSGSSLTLTESKYSKGTLKIEETSLKDVPTQLSGTFRQSVAASENKIIRTSNEAIAYFGRRDDNLNLWAYQAPTSVALVLEFWLAYRLELNQVVTLDTYLNAIALQPGDVITLDITNGAGTNICNAIPARVKTLRHQPGSANHKTMERISVLCECPLWTWTIDVLVPTTRNCNAPGSAPNTAAGYGGGSGAGWIPLPSYIPGVTISSGGGGSGGSGSSWPRLAKTSSSISKGSAGTVTLYDGTPGSESASGGTVSAFAKFGDLDGLTIGSGKFVWLDQTPSGQVYIVTGEHTEGSGIVYPRLCKTLGSIAKGASGSVIVQVGIGYGSSAGPTIAPFNPFGGCQSGSAIGSGKYVWVDESGEGYIYIVDTEA